VDLLRSEDPAERRRAVGAIGRVGDALAVELLSPCLSDPDVDVTHDAAKMLAIIGSDAAVACLLQVISDERNALVRRVVAASALADVHEISEHAVAVLRELLLAPLDPWLKAAVCGALVQLQRY
jgi:HEAT repeat protein